MNRKGPRVGRYLIYGLLDPRDFSLRYIGKTHKRREFRLAEHIQDSLDGSMRPVHVWIRKLIELEMQPTIFVLERVPAEARWDVAERNAIREWRNWPQDRLPHYHPPQTPRSTAVIIQMVKLLNVRDGG